VDRITLSLPLIQGYFYQQRRHQPEGWKIQPHRFGSTSQQQPEKRGPYHWLFLGCNLLTASAFAGIAAEGAVRGWPTSRLHTGRDEAVVLMWELLLLVVALAWQSVWEYWWHRLMHQKWCYMRMHKFHHFYKVWRESVDGWMDGLEGSGRVPSWTALSTAGITKAPRTSRRC
jgi:sterol desaturase/sphingolipid hydroxylase (fatty acid hydroxylase superfamily)